MSSDDVWKTSKHHSLRDRIAEVQSDHQPIYNGCLCGWEYDPAVDNSHFNHVADAVIAALGLRREDGKEVTWWPAPRRYRYVTEWIADE